MAIRLGLRSYAEPGTAHAYNPDNNESLADFIKRQNIGSFTLGPFEVNPLELANVAATLASGGMWCPPTRLTRFSTAAAMRFQFAPRPASRWCRRAGQHPVQRTEPRCHQRHRFGAAGSVGWTLPMSAKTGTTEAHRSSGFLGYTNRYAAANYIYDDSPIPPTCAHSRFASAGTATSSAAMSPPRPGSRRSAPSPRISVSGDAAERPALRGRRAQLAGAQRQRDESGQGSRRVAHRRLQVADQVSMQNSTSSAGTVVGTSPRGQTVPGIIVTLLVSNGIAPPPPPHHRRRQERRRRQSSWASRMPEIGSTVVEIPWPSAHHDSGDRPPPPPPDQGAPPPP